MKIPFANLKKLTAAQIARYILFFFNAVSLVFSIVYSAAHTATAASDVFAVIAIVTLVLDVLYATVTKNGFGFWYILGAGFSMLALYGFSMLAGMMQFKTSANIAGSVIMCAVFLAAAALISADALRLPHTNRTPGRLYKAVRVALVAAGGIALIVFAVLTYDAVYNFGYSVHEYSTTRAEFLLAFAAFAILCMLIRITLTEGAGNLKEKFVKGWAFLLVVCGLGVFTFANYATQMGSLAGDIENADTAFAAAFGADALIGQSDMRQMQYSFADSLFGIPTGGFSLTKDVVYKQENGLTLRFDAYVPTAAAAHKSVIVAIHGRGNDKGNMSVPHRNKYFASKGYVVFDLQVGDFLEKDTGVDNSRKPASLEMLPNIDAFFRYIASHNDYGANLNSVFITGYSMGGNLTAKYGLSYQNAAAEYGVTLKGLIPCYPSYYAGDEGIDNFLDYVDRDSLPMLMLMGWNDGLVNRDVVYETEDAYAAAENPDFAAIGISYSGHGCDISMVSRANQIFIYYMERFLYNFR